MIPDTYRLTQTLQARASTVALQCRCSSVTFLFRVTYRYNRLTTVEPLNYYGKPKVQTFVLNAAGRPFRFSNDYNTL